MGQLERSYNEEEEDGEVLDPDEIMMLQAKAQEKQRERTSAGDQKPPPNERHSSKNNISNLSPSPSQSSEGRRQSPRRREHKPGAYAFGGIQAGAGTDDTDEHFIDNPNLDRLDTEAAVVPGLVEASLIKDAEKVHEAYDVKEDLSRRNNFIIASTCIILVAVAITLAVHYTKKGNSPVPVARCDLPIESQSLALRCYCDGTTRGFYSTLSGASKQVYQSQAAYLRKLGIMDRRNEIDAGFDVDSCERDNLNLLITANISESSEEGSELFNSVTADFRLTVYAFINIYLDMGGLDWSDSENWLEPDFCSWAGVSCVFSDLLISELELKDNDLNGTLPTDLGVLRSLQKLEISESDGVFGSIPSEVSTLTSLRELILSDTSLSSTIPTQLGDLHRIDEIDLSDNELTGTIPSEVWTLSTLRFLRLAGNNFSGPVAADFAPARSLAELELSHNSLTGTLPTNMADLSNLEILSLTYNNFSGPIPDVLGEFPRLGLLLLEGSGFDATAGIPDSLCNSEVSKVVSIDCPYASFETTCSCCNRTDPGAKVRIVCVESGEE
eukprot:Nitzschia sp. Nitz4//scaffold76_size158648//82979//84714//NITZ4_002550-RA/size158648-augustus-gene-0.136-mRNA-1//1//CDS//3329557857//3643//frame0